MGTIGTIDPVIVCQFKDQFVSRCVEMIEWACFTLKSKKTIDINWGEENITANIYVLIYDSQRSIDYDIIPECEHPFFDKDVLANKKKAKGAPRIDLVFQHNWSGQRFFFYVEAKNLIEANAHKTGRKTVTKVSNVLGRYIDTGMNHYMNGHYPQGCLLGYVLNGTIQGVVSALNAKLSEQGRGAEILASPVGTSPWMCYQSQHEAHGITLTHYLFEFC